MNTIQEQETLITASFIPEKESHILYFNSTPILSLGNISGIVAETGIGKSQLCEYITSIWLQECISHSTITSKLKTDSQKSPLLYIDTERPDNNIYDGIKRIISTSECSDSQFDEFIKYHKFIKIDSPQKRVIKIEELLQLYQPRLVIIDGLLDLLLNPNDIIESTNLGYKLVSLTNIYNCGILYTIHSNRGDVSGKGKGHVGDIFQRKSSTFLKLQYCSKDPNSRILTANFPNGKVRNGTLDLETKFTWNTDKLRFVEILENTINTESVSKIRKDNIIKNNFKMILTEPLNHSQILEKYSKMFLLSTRTINRHIQEAIQSNYIKKENDLYSLCQ